MVMIDRQADWHTHSDISDGADPPGAMLAAARAANLATWGLSDHVRSDTTWVPDYVAMVKALDSATPDVKCAVETKIVDVTGALDLPKDLRGLDYLLIADHQFPGPDGPIHPNEVRDRIRRGRVSPADVIEQLLRATTAAVRSSPLPAIVAHLFSVLPKCGVSPDLVTADLLADLGAACLASDAAVEANEKWRCPTPAALTSLAALGVRITAGSDAHRAADVGRWTYRPELQAVTT